MLIRLLAVLVLSATIVRANTIAQFRTIGGDLEVELFTEDKPVTCRNFIRLVEAGAYQNTFLHRLVPGFVIQGGGFWVPSKSDTNYFTGFGFVPHFGPITNEFSIGPYLTNDFGTIAMAKTTNGPDTATCQFFFNLANNSTNLDVQNGGFTVFGRVVKGTNLLQFWNTLGYSTGIVDQTFFFGPTFSAFTTLPVTYLGWTPARYSQLLYVDVTLMRVAVSNLADGTSMVSWKSAGGLTNIVEAATSFSPPEWVLLHTTNGTGGTMSYADTNSAAGGRFYRIRVER